MEDKVIKVEATGAAMLPMAALEPFQNDLKRLEREQYEKLRKNILELGFSFPFHVWASDGHNYLIDGHQRLTALKLMVENEGWQVPDLPVVYVNAKDMQEAKRKVLAAASQYGKLSDKGLYEFLQSSAISLEEFASKFDFPEINLQKFGENFFNLPKIEVPVDESLPPELKHASDQVRQVQLFFDAESYTEFMVKVEVLGEMRQTKNVSDTVMELVREAHSLIKPVTT